MKLKYVASTEKTIKVSKIINDGWDAEYLGFFSLHYNGGYGWTSRDCKNLTEAELTEILTKIKELNGFA